MNPPDFRSSERNLPTLNSGGRTVGRVEKANQSYNLSTTVIRFAKEQD